MDDIILARMITPALTTVTRPFKTICGKAVEMLLALKEGHAVRDPRGGRAGHHGA